MRLLDYLHLIFGFLGIACAGHSNSIDDAGSSTDSCKPGATLSGTAYDISKSRFAFGSNPVRDTSATTLTRWVGTDGVVAVYNCGSELGIMNAGAPEAALADWSSDSGAQAAHVSDYYVAMGLEPCQIANQQIFSSGCAANTDAGASCKAVAGSSSIDLLRAIGGISVAESHAYARFNVDDQTTSEGLYWPTISADTVTAAREFSAHLADAPALAAYKMKLPATAQGDGTVVIHHSNCFGSTTGTFQSAATYDVMQSDLMGMAATLSFDIDGNPDTNVW